MAKPLLDKQKINSSTLFVGTNYYKLSLVKKVPIVNNKDLPVNKDKTKVFKV